MKKIMTFINGVCMALADSVPGVSGGTVAFIMGFYDDFINALNDIISGTWEKRKAAFFYLINLGIGWAISFIIAILILATVFEQHIYAISSLFIGFIVFAIPIVVIEEKDVLKSKPLMSIYLFAGIAIVLLITYFNPVGGGESMNLDDPNILTYLYVFVAGMIAICAMILPGISGSTLLLIFGLYLPIITGIKDVLHLDFSPLPILIVFAFGVLAGIVFIIKLIKLLLEKHRSAMIYLIIGLMLGSIYSIIMGPETLDVPQEHMTWDTFSIIFCLIGGVVILGMQAAKKLVDSKTKQDS